MENLCRFVDLKSYVAQKHIILSGLLDLYRMWISAVVKNVKTIFIFVSPQISCLHCCGVVAKCQQLHYVLAVKVYRVVALAVIASLMTIEKQAYSVRREGRITLTPFKYNLSKEQRFIAQRKTSMHFWQNAPQRFVNYTVKWHALGKSICFFG